jgi:hypothetical protein
MMIMAGSGSPRSVSFDYSPPNGNLFQAAQILTKLDQHHGRGSYRDGDATMEMDDYRPFTLTNFRPGSNSVTICTEPADVDILRVSFDNILSQPKK